MNLNSSDLDDAIMRGEAMFAQWQREFEQQWDEQKLQQAVAVLVATTPPEVLAQMPPEQLQQAIELTGIGG